MHPQWKVACFCVPTVPFQVKTRARSPDRLQILNRLKAILTWVPSSIRCSRRWKRCRRILSMWTWFWLELLQDWPVIRSRYSARFSSTTTWFWSPESDHFFRYVLTLILEGSVLILERLFKVKLNDSPIVPTYKRDSSIFAPLKKVVARSFHAVIMGAEASLWFWLFLGDCRCFP